MKNFKLFILWTLFAHLLGSCQCGSNLGPVFYGAWIFYRNAKGEDLLDAKTKGHFESPKIDGLDAFQPFRKTEAGSSGFPIGYYMYVELKTNKTKIIILLNNTISDTLSYTFSGTKLTSCEYNRTNVLQANDPHEFPVLIVK